MKLNSFRGETCPPSDSATTTLVVAMRIAQKYIHRVPTPGELRSDHGMSRATAYRWIKAFRDAKGLP
jgi:hypothetical protein